MASYQKIVRLPYIPGAGLSEILAHVGNHVTNDSIKVGNIVVIYSRHSTKLTANYINDIQHLIKYINMPVECLSR